MEDKKKILQTEKRNRFFVLFQSLLVIIKDEKNNSSFLRSQVGVVICQDDFTERLRWNYSREILASSNTDCSLACNYLGFKIDFIFHRSIFCFVEFGSILDRKKIRMAASKNIGGLGVSTCESSRSNASSLLQGQGRDELSITKLIFPCAATPTWIVIKKRYPKIIVLLFFPLFFVYQFYGKHIRWWQEIINFQRKINKVIFGTIMTNYSRDKSNKIITVIFSRDLFIY